MPKTNYLRFDAIDETNTMLFQPFGITEERADEIEEALSKAWDKMDEDGFSVEEYIKSIVHVPQTPEEAFTVGFGVSRRIAIAKMEGMGFLGAMLASKL